MVGVVYRVRVSRAGRGGGREGLEFGGRGKYRRWPVETCTCWCLWVVERRRGHCGATDTELVFMGSVQVWVAGQG